MQPYFFIWFIVDVSDRLSYAVTESAQPRITQPMSGSSSHGPRAHDTWQPNACYLFSRQLSNMVRAAWEGNRHGCERTCKRRRSINQENIRKSASHMTTGHPGVGHSHFLVPGSRKDHFQSVNLKAIENISQLHLVVPVLEIPASKIVSAVQGNWKCQPEKPQQPQSTELLLARKYCGLN